MRSKLSRAVTLLTVYNPVFVANGGSAAEYIDLVRKMAQDSSEEDAIYQVARDILALGAYIHKSRSGDDGEKMMDLGKSLLDLNH